jgi:ApaG protein
MDTLVTHGIKISVVARYQEEYSQPEQLQFYYSYHIRIENKADYTVQLMRRHWLIFDSAGGEQEVEGEGVVGNQPVLNPGEVYEYQSACYLKSEIGSMHGTYLFVRKVDGQEFKVQIPRFTLIAPYRLN